MAFRSGDDRRVMVSPVRNMVRAGSFPHEEAGDFSAVPADPFRAPCFAAGEDTDERRASA